MKLCPTEIEREPFDLRVKQIQLHHIQGNFIIPRCIDRYIFLCVEVAVIHLHRGIYIANAHIETKAQEPSGEGLNCRTGIRKDADISRLILGAQGIDVRLVQIHFGRCGNLRNGANGTYIPHSIREEILDCIPDVTVSIHRRNTFLCVRLAGLAHLAGGRSAGCNFYILTGNGISCLAISAHANLRISAVADVPGVKLRIGGGVNDHVPCISGVNGAVINGHPRYAHGRARRRHFDISTGALGSLRGNIGRFDDEHAAMLRRFRIRLQVCSAIHHRQRNLSAIRKNRAILRGEIAIGFHGNLTTVRLRCPAIHGDVSTGREHNAVRCGCGRGGPLDACCIDEAISILCGSAVGRRVKDSAGAKERAGEIHIFFCGNQEAVFGVDGAADGNHGIFLRAAAAPISAVFQMSSLLRKGLAKKIRAIYIHRGASDQRIIAAIKEHFASPGIGAQGETAYIDDAAGADCDAFIREEIHIAADFPVFQCVHHAIDVDFIVYYVDLVIHIAQIQIGNVRLVQGEIIEPVQRFIATDPLVCDFVFLSVRSGNHALYHRRAILALIRHGDCSLSHRAAGRRHSKRREDAGFQRFLPLVRPRDFRSHHIAAPGCIPYDFIYFIHKSSLR